MIAIVDDSKALVKKLAGVFMAPKPTVVIEFANATDMYKVVSCEAVELTAGDVISFAEVCTRLDRGEKVFLLDRGLKIEIS